MPMVSGPQGPHVVLDGKPVLSLSSDNYLGLADHPQVRKAAAEAALRWGVGAGSGRLDSGTMTLHRRLEKRAAQFVERETALLFGAGYLANLGVIDALARPGDVVFCDELAHASIADGCRLSGAEVFVYEHCDTEQLAWGIREAGGRAALIATESVFSMDGDMAPLEDIVELAQRHRVRVLVDEAHGIGTLGPGGRGALAALGLEDQVDVIVGTLGKALGSHGGFVACDRVMTHYLLNAARTLTFSTAPPPPAVAGALAALNLLEERPRLVEKLRVNAAAMRAGLEDEGFGVPASSTPVMTIVVGDPELTLRICERALGRGLFAHALTSPAVAAAASRVRLTVMASHRAEELRAAAGVLGQVARAVGFDPSMSIVFEEPDEEVYEADAVEAYAVEQSGPFDYEQAARAA
jgi:glycine C-acetyltransferase/8-amino-7-oxononanoate synthase